MSHSDSFNMSAFCIHTSHGPSSTDACSKLPACTAVAACPAQACTHFRGQSKTSVYSQDPPTIRNLSTCARAVFLAHTRRGTHWLHQIKNIRTDYLSSPPACRQTNANMRWTLVLAVVMTVVPVGAWEMYCCWGSGPCVGSCATAISPPSPPPPDDYYISHALRDRRQATSECQGLEELGPGARRAHQAAPLSASRVKAAAQAAKPKLERLRSTRPTAANGRRSTSRVASRRHLSGV
jgi:hypothetical protein